MLAYLTRAFNDYVIPKWTPFMNKFGNRFKIWPGLLFTHVHVYTIQHYLSQNTLLNCIFLFYIFSQLFQRKFSADIGWVGGRAASTIRLKFWLIFCFLTITKMFLNGID